MKKTTFLVFIILLVASVASAARFLNNPITTSQNLSSAQLSYTTSVGRPFILDEITIHASTPITETVTITRDSATGANYDTVLVSESLTAVSNFVFRPTGVTTFYRGDEVKVQCTNSGGSGIVYVEIKTSEIG